MSEKMYRQNFDKRTSRKQFGRSFQQAIKVADKKKEKKLKKKKQVGKNIYQRGMKKFSVYVRKRPIFSHELRNGEYDIVRAHHKENSITVHNCLMRPDLKIENAYVESTLFKGFEGVFSENDDNNTVYQRSVMPLVQFIISGKSGTLFMFGQTGSGKTHTITGMMENIVEDIFSWMEFMPHIHLTCSCFEMSGDDCCDLLARREKVILRTDSDGSIKVCGIHTVPSSCGQEVLETIDQAFASRKTIATKVNSVSSRSHCIFRMNLINKTTNELYGRLTLIDLAGSERNEDTSHHTTERIVESCKINSSLMALKDCIRVYNEIHRNHQKLHIPYRSDKLCMLLKDCFLSKSVRTVIITTCSPNPTDTEHTMHTLKNTCLMNEKSDVVKTKTNIKDVVTCDRNLVVHPSKWSIEETRNWLLDLNGGRYAKYIHNFPSQLDGKQITRWTAKRFIQVCDGKTKVGTMIRKLLVKEMKKYEKFKFGNFKENQYPSSSSSNTQHVPFGKKKSDFVSGNGNRMRVSRVKDFRF